MKNHKPIVPKNKCISCSCFRKSNNKRSKTGLTRVLKKKVFKSKQTLKTDSFKQTKRHRKHCGRYNFLENKYET